MTEEACLETIDDCFHNNISCSGTCKGVIVKLAKRIAQAGGE